MVFLFESLNFNQIIKINQFFFALQFFFRFIPSLHTGHLNGLDELFSVSLGLQSLLPMCCCILSFLANRLLQSGHLCGFCNLKRSLLFKKSLNVILFHYIYFYFYIFHFWFVIIIIIIVFIIFFLSSAAFFLVARIFLTSTLCYFI